MRKLSVVLALLLVLSVSGAALGQEVGGAHAVVGKIGVGYTTSNAPLGIRMWFSETFGFDAGLGLVLHGNERDVESDDPDDTTTTADFAVDLGFLMSLFKSENSILYGRVGLNFDRRYGVGARAAGDPRHSSREVLGIGVWGGIELFMTALGFPNLSLQGAVGLGFEHVSPVKTPGSESDWTFGTFTTGVSLVGTAQLGFHYYF